MDRRLVIIIFGILPCLAGCATMVQKDQRLAVGEGHILNTADDEGLADATSAIETVAGSLAQKDLSEQEAQRIVEDIRHDEDAQSAVRAISSSFDQDQVVVKYSPVTGKRYSADMEFDPETGVALLPVE